MELNKVFARQFVKVDGTVLNIGQLEVGDVGCVVWDAAIVLAHFIDTPSFYNELGAHVLNGKYVIELGSGTGLVGIQAAVNGANCIVTDLEDFIPLLNLNVDYNKSAVKGHIEARVLRWGESVDDFLPHPNYLFLADCLYYDEGVEPLFKTLCQLSDSHTMVYLCYEIRSMQGKKLIEDKFFELIKSQFSIEKIPIELQNPDYSSDDIVIFKFMKKS